MNNKKLNSVVIVSVAYVAAQMLADITAVRVVILAGMSIDAGTFVYPFTFTLRDMAHKIAGIKTARILILAAAGINVLMALLFKFVAWMPADLQVGEQAEFGIVLAPLWRIVWASIIAEVVSEFIDGEVYQAWVNRMGQKRQWARVLVSNAVSVPIDSVLFVGIAFFGVLPIAVVGSILLANILIKGLVTLISMPWIYLVKGN